MLSGPVAGAGAVHTGITREKVLLAVMGLTTFGFGCTYLIAPQAMAAQSGLAITRAAAEAELRGYYGGLQVGMGVLFFAGLRWPAVANAGLWAAAILFAGNGLGRVLGIALARAVDSFNASGVAFEFLFSGCAIALLRADTPRKPAGSGAEAHP